MKKVTLLMIVCALAACSTSTEKKIEKWVTDYEASTLSSGEKIESIKIDSLGYNLSSMKEYYAAQALRFIERKKEYEADYVTSEIRISNNLLIDTLTNLMNAASADNTIYLVSYHYNIKTDQDTYDELAHTWFHQDGRPVTIDLTNLINPKKLNARLAFIDSVKNN